ncbi:MAG: hypothetical protein ACK5O3_16940 [Burkholderiales bacterium]
MYKDSTILALQVVASVLMATDYFLNDKERGVVNSAIQRIVGPLQGSIDQSLRNGVSYVAAQWAKILVSTLFLAIAWLGGVLLQLVAPQMEPFLIAAMALVLLALVAGAAPQLATILATTAVFFALAAPLRLVTTFLLRCPKGSVFGVGFIVLLASFACRYANLR